MLSSTQLPLLACDHTLAASLVERDAGAQGAGERAAQGEAGRGGGAVRAWGQVIAGHYTRGGSTSDQHAFIVLCGLDSYLYDDLCLAHAACSFQFEASWQVFGIVLLILV